MDGAKAESVVNLTGNRLGVFWTANAFLAVGGFLLWQVISQVVRSSHSMGLDRTTAKLPLRNDTSMSLAVCRTTPG